MRCVYLYTIPMCTDMEAEEYEKIFTLINDGTYIEGKKLFNLVVIYNFNLGWTCDNKIGIIRMLFYIKLNM